MNVFYVVQISEKSAHHSLGAFKILRAAKEPAGSLPLDRLCSGSGMGGRMRNKDRDGGNQDAGELHYLVCFAK